MFFNPGGGNGQGGLPPQFAQMFGAGGFQAGNTQGVPVDLEQLFGQAGLFNANAGMPFGMPQHMQQQQQPDPRDATHAPTAASTLQNLPRIKVRLVDLEANESNECSICIDELEVGQEAMRIPCGHLYHEECVKDWLKKSNECPVCRYELPTDNAEFERGRRERMAGRKIRLRRSDLTVKTAKELRRLSDFLCVDVSGCLEKSEFVNAILSSSKVELIAGDDSPKSCPPLSQDSLMESVDVPAETPISPLNSNCVGGGAAPTAAPLASMSVAQLGRLAVAKGISLNGCLEKCDIVEKLESQGVS